MTTLLLCNIGRSDLQLNRKVTPEELPDAQLKQERTRGLYFANNFEDLYADLDLAIIRKAVDYIDAHTIDHIGLFASDQTDEQYRMTDTIETAKVVREVLIRRWKIAPDRIHIISLSKDPSDHDAMIQAQSRELTRLDRQLQPDTVYLEVTGGTPAMTNALLLAGTEIFQDRAIALYISRESEMPSRLAVGKRLLAGPVRKVLKANLATFHYTAALETWMLYRPYFIDTDSKGVADVIEGLIKHLAVRINLDLPEAQRTIKGLDIAANGNYRQQIEGLYNALTPLTREKSLAELLHVAQIRLNTQAWGEFLSQVVRFIENSLRLVCLRLGVPFINFDKPPQPDENGAKVDPQWIKQRNLEAVSQGQKGLQNLLQQIAPDDITVRAVLTIADKCEKLIYLRNANTHSLSGTSESQLRTAFGADPREILPLLDTVYTTVVAMSRSENPYLTTNNFLVTLLENH